jgi:hypothetical protein
MVGLALSALIWSVDSKSSGPPSGEPEAITLSESTLGSEPAYVAGLATDVFAGVRGPFVRLRNVAMEGSLPTYTTDYQVVVTESLKGKRRPGDVVTVRQFGGSDGSISSYIPGDEPMVEGQEYLFVTRPTSDGLAFGIFDPLVGKVSLISEQVRERELDLWRTIINAPILTESPEPTSPLIETATLPDPIATTEPTATATTEPTATATTEPTATAEPSPTREGSPAATGG